MKNINKYFLVVTIVAVISLIYSGVEGSKQISQRKKDYTTYAEVKSTIQEGENLEGAMKKIEKLQKTYNDSYVFNIDKGIICNGLKESKKALKEFEKAFEKNKSLYKNANLLIIYAEVAHLSGDDKKAEETISKAKEIGIPQEQQKTVDKLLSEIK